jgi:hypothetical protein
VFTDSLYVSNVKQHSCSLVLGMWPCTLSLSAHLADTCCFVVIVHFCDIHTLGQFYPTRHLQAAHTICLAICPRQLPILSAHAHAICRCHLPPPPPHTPTLTPTPAQMRPSYTFRLTCSF